MSGELEPRASDADRERVALVLRDAMVEGRLTLDEFATRLEQAYDAKTTPQLEALTRDLPAPAARPPRRASRLHGVLFGHFMRKGRWRVPRRGLVLVGFGDADVDLRRAEVSAPVVTLTALVAFGNVDFYVPEGIEVDLGGLAIFGHRGDHGHDPDPVPGSPLVRIRVFSLFGASDVWRIPPGASGDYRKLIDQVRRQRSLAR